MKLKELNVEVFYTTDFQLIEQYQPEFLLLLEKEGLTDEILDEGFVGDLIDKAKNKITGVVSTAEFLKNVWNDESTLNTVSGMLHSTTFKTIINPFYKKIAIFITKLDEISTKYSQNITLVNSVNVIKNLVITIKNSIYKVYQAVSKLAGKLKLLASLGFSFTAKQLTDKIGNFLLVLDTLDVTNPRKIMEFLKNQEVFKDFNSSAMSMWNSIKITVNSFKDVGVEILNKVGFTGLLEKIAGTIGIVYTSVKTAVAYILSVMEVAKTKMQNTQPSPATT